MIDKKYINPILNTILVLIILAILCVIAISCNIPKGIYQYHSGNTHIIQDEPIIFGEGGVIESRHYYVEPFYEEKVDTVCNHFFVSMTIQSESDSTYDPMVYQVITEMKIYGSMPCICIYCHEIKMCY